MINLKNLDKWKHLVTGEMMTFANPNPRTVRIEVNAPFETRCYVTPVGQDEPQFVGVVHGLDVIEFGTGGAFTFYGDGDFSLYSAEVEAVAFEVLEPVKFTEIAERRTRNPELEHVMRRMQENTDRRMAAVIDSFNGQLKALSEVRNVNPPAPAPIAPSAQPEPVPVVAQPGSAAGGTGGGGDAPAAVVAAQ